ncbi:MAG: signal peptide peptidase SppA [Chthoniobacterales bacterium]|nr:signal peptide peptidase SppA [Chthoniobacterales bacterium]
MSRRRIGCLGVLVFLVLCVSLFLNLLFIGILVERGGVGKKITRHNRSLYFSEEVLVEGSKQKVVVIPLEGMIAYDVIGTSGYSMVEEFRIALEQAAEDPDVVAVVVSVDSPGGEITASDVIYSAIKKFSEKKPILAFINSVGASGAYYASCGADYLMCNPTTLTGSIGVIITTLNYKELFGKLGLKSVVFKSGKFKDMLSGGRDMTPEEESYIQGLVMQSYERFLKIVAESRNLKAESLRDGAADGRILSGEDALKEKLVDDVGYVEDCYEQAMELAGVKGASVVRYEPSFRLSRFLQLLGESRVGKIEMKVLPQSKWKLEPGRVYLLPELFVE